MANLCNKVALYRSIVEQKIFISGITKPFGINISSLVWVTLVKCTKIHIAAFDMKPLEQKPREQPRLKGDALTSQESSFKGF